MWTLWAMLMFQAFTTPTLGSMSTQVFLFVFLNLFFCKWFIIVFWAIVKLDILKKKGELTTKKLLDLEKNEKMTYDPQSTIIQYANVSDEGNWVQNAKKVEK